LDSWRHSEGEKSVLWKVANKLSKEYDRVVLQEFEKGDTEENNKDGKHADANRKCQ
jgi:uncharacterized protein YcnI